MSTMLGIFIGDILSRKTVGFLTVFFLLMGLNICLWTTFWWQNLPSSLWLAFPGLLWFPIAWTVKVGLFLTSLGILTPSGAGVPLWVLLAALSLAVPNAGNRLYKLIEPKGGQSTAENEVAGLPDKKERKIASGLVALMLILWGIRASQGLVQWEVLRSVALTFVRTLSLPALWTIFSLISWKRSTATMK